MYIFIFLNCVIVASGTEPQRSRISGISWFLDVFSIAILECGIVHVFPKIWLTILYVPTIPVSHYEKYILPYLLNAVKPLIPSYLNSPGKVAGIRKVVDIMESEKWMSTCEGQHNRFY